MTRVVEHYRNAYLHNNGWNSTRVLQELNVSTISKYTELGVTSESSSHNKCYVAVVSI